MKESIKVKAEVKQTLFDMKQPGEDFNGVIERLLKVAAIMVKMQSYLDRDRQSLQRRLDHITAGESLTPVIGTDLEGHPLIDRPRQEQT
jgi:hypothetical protein